MEKKIAAVFQGKIDSALVIYFPKKGKSIYMNFNLCGHDLLNLAKQITKAGKEALAEEKLLNKKNKKS